MNTSLARRAALLLALATTAAPLLAQRSAAGDRRPPAAPQPPEAPQPPAIVEDVTVTLGDAAESTVHDRLHQAQAQVGRASSDMKRQFSQMRVNFNGPASIRTLLVPGDGTTPEQIGHLREELAIMSRIFTKAGDPEAGKHGGFRFNFVGLGGGHGTDLDALYLDGYGAVFPLDVDFPLVAPAKAAEKKAEPKADKDAAWEKARRELAGGQEEEESDDDSGDKNPAPFDAEKVAALRTRLTEAFRHAANLKSVRPEEQIVLVVSSTASRSGGQPEGAHKIITRVLSSGSSGSSIGSGKNVNIFAVPENNGGPGHQQLTLRVKKSEVDAFAAGRLSAEEFRKKVSTSSSEEPGSVRP